MDRRILYRNGEREGEEDAGSEMSINFSELNLLVSLSNTEFWLSKPSMRIKGNVKYIN